jgi:hypothetical protein
MNSTRTIAVPEYLFWEDSMWIPKNLGSVWEDDGCSLLLVYARSVLLVFQKNDSLTSARAFACSLLLSQFFRFGYSRSQVRILLPRPTKLLILLQVIPTFEGVIPTGGSGGVLTYFHSRHWPPCVALRGLARLPIDALATPAR